MHLYKISKSNVGIGIDIERGADNQKPLDLPLAFSFLAVVLHIPSGCMC